MAGASKSSWSAGRCLVAAATLAVTTAFAGNAFVASPQPMVAGGVLTSERIGAQAKSAAPAMGAFRRTGQAAASWHVVGAAMLLCASAAMPRRSSKSSTGARCAVVGCQAAPAPVMSVAAPAPCAAPVAPQLAPVEPMLIDLTASEETLPQQVFTSVPVPIVAPVVSVAAVQEVAPEAEPKSEPLGSPTRGAARFVGGARRSQNRSFFGTGRAASRAARRSMGARIMPCVQAEPAVMPYDASKVRAPIQNGVKLVSCLHSRRSKDIKSPTNNKETCDEGVGISSNYFDMNEESNL